MIAAGFAPSKSLDRLQAEIRLCEKKEPSLHLSLTRSFLGNASMQVHCWGYSFAQCRALQRGGGDQLHTVQEGGHRETEVGPAPCRDHLSDSISPLLGWHRLQSALVPAERLVGEQNTAPVGAARGDAAAHKGGMSPASYTNPFWALPNWRGQIPSGGTPRSPAKGGCFVS